MNFKLKRTEIQVLNNLMLGASGIAHESLLNRLKIDRMVLAPHVVLFDQTQEDDLVKSLSKLLVDLDRNAQMREVKHELKLFESPESDCYRALCMLERIRLLYSSLGFPFPELANTSSVKEKNKYLKLLLEWSILYKMGYAEKLAKYQSVSMFNKVMNVEPLESIVLPFSWCLGSLTPYGKMHHKVQKLMVKSSLGEKLRLAQCFLYFKKGCPPASQKFIDETVKKHKQALTRLPPPIDTLSFKDKDSTMVVPRASIKERAEKVVYEVFKNYKAPETFWEPSRNGCYHSSRSKGGQMSEVEFLAQGWSYQLVRTGRKVFYTRDSFGCKVNFKDVIECCYRPRDGSDGWEYFDTGYSFIKVPTEVNPVLKLTKLINAKPVALTEPLKVRVITCEDSWSTYSLTGAQKGLWSCLHNHHWFALTGRPVGVSDVPVDPTKDWISVDYSAATDNLSSEFSRIVIQYICDLTGLPFQLCFDSLCNHNLDYKKFKTIGEECRQTNGQLMGSILSFIVLCICNAVVISLAVNPGSFNPNETFLVNGDDGLFLGGDLEYRVWERLSSHVGLSPSIGKVYRSREFCVINSTCFVTVDGLVRECAYPNASGMMQFDARTYTKPKSPLDLKDSLSLWLSGFVCKTQRSQAESLWYSTFDPILKTDWVSTFSIDWYLPQSLGGLGLPLREEVEDRIVCREALARARWCVSNRCVPWRKRIRRNSYTYYGTRYFGYEKNNRGAYVHTYTDMWNPFSEGDTWIKCESTRMVTDEVYNELRHVGWDTPVEVVCQSLTEEYVTNYMSQLVPHMSEGGSAVALSCLNGVGPVVSSGTLDSSDFDFFRDLSRLRRDKKLQHYWENFREVHARSFQFLNFVSGGRKLHSWNPKIPNTDLIFGQHYHKWLNTLHSQRSDAVDENLVGNQNPFSSD